jgi:uncharacterized membrane protein
MTTQTDDEIGTIDYVVLEFPGNRFNGEITPALVDLLRSGLIRIIDLVFIHKDEDGTVTAVELEDADPDEAGHLSGLPCDIPGLLSDEDVDKVGEVLEPNSSAALLVWENVWAAPFAGAVRRAGGQLVASGRIPLDDLLESLADEPVADA